ncbi:MAG: AI-2E family transporter [Bacillota bacterium]|nr:AI-2E family transporter [Bacillota bacterium]
MFKFRRFKYFNLIPIIFVSIVMFKLVNNYEILGTVISKILSLMTYFIWGYAIAYLLNPLMMSIERVLKTKRPISILITYVIFLSLIAMFFILVIPGMIKSIGDILGRLPYYVSQLEKYINGTIANNDFFQKYGINQYASDNLNEILDRARKLLELSFNAVITNVINLSSLLLNLFTGIVISVYFLMEKDDAINYSKKILYTFLDNDDAGHIISVAGKVNLIFKQYVVGKTIDSIIIGLLCFVLLTITGVKFALIISLIIAITNMIPYFGNTIGLIPTVILTILTGGGSVVKLIAVVIGLSLFDGWFLGPKIIGDKVGLSPVWIIVAIAVGGGLYGMVGMFIAVPITAVVKTSIEAYIDRISTQKKLLEEKAASK